jgi:hypothetical protein
VYEEADGSIAGFLGIVPRRVTINGRRYHAAISSQFVVEPSTHGGIVALRLARAFLDGPQDLSISDEANDTSRKIWEGLGGTTSLLHSLYWTRPLRPARLALLMLRRRPRLWPIAMAAAPLVPVIDAIAAAMAARLFAQPAPDISWADDLTARTILACLPRCTRAGWLRVEYDERTLGWTLEQARRRRRTGSVLTTVVRQGERVVGWFVYHLDDERVVSVLQMAAEPARIGELLDQLFSHAARHRAIAVSGRVDPCYLQALTDRYCLLHRRGPWVLVHSRYPELLRPFHTGDAWFSRLDGEWCLGYGSG